MAAIATLLLVGGSVAATSAAVVRLLLKLKIDSTGSRLATKIAMTRPVPAVPRTQSTALQNVQAQEATFRAAFILHSAKRYQAQARAGKPAGQILATERRFFLNHLAAAAKRTTSAKLVDRAAKREGDKLGWYTVRDSRTSPECRAAHGTNFEVDSRPAIGYPGAVHPHCRCTAGKPHANASSTDAATRRFIRRTA